MKKRPDRGHSIDALFSVLLFGLFVLFLLLMILFSARAYRTSAEKLEENNNLYTAAAYITTKFRQHDTPENIFVREFEGQEALCFLDTIDGTDYITYIYLQDQELKELFTAEGSLAGADMGMSLAALTGFDIRQQKDGFYHITLTDSQGASTSFLLHQGVSAAVS